MQLNHHPIFDFRTSVAGTSKCICGHCPNRDTVLVSTLFCIAMKEVLTLHLEQHAHASSQSSVKQLLYQVPRPRFSSSYLLLNLRSPRDYVVRSFVRPPSVVCSRLWYVLDRQLINGWSHRHQNRRLCSRPHSNESVIFFRIFGIHIFQVMASLVNLV